MNALLNRSTTGLSFTPTPTRHSYAALTLPYTFFHRICSSVRLIIYTRAFVPSDFHENLHTLQNLLLQVCSCYVLAWKTTICSVEVKRLQCVPDPMDFVRRQGYHVRIRPHEAECRCSWISIRSFHVGEARLEHVSHTVPSYDKGLMHSCMRNRSQNLPARSSWCPQ